MDHNLTDINALYSALINMGCGIFVLSCCMGAQLTLTILLRHQAVPLNTYINLLVCAIQLSFLPNKGIIQFIKGMLTLEIVYL